jgi:ribonuclease J
VARIEFWGGVGVTGSSKIVVRDGGWRVLLAWAADSRATADREG